MPIARSSLTGAAAGVVLLAGVVGFGVGLPEVVGGPDASASADLPTLPDRLDDRFVALSAVTPELGGAQTAEEISQMEAFADQAAKSEADANERLRDLYGDVTLRSYLDVPATTAAEPQGRPAQFAVTVVEGDAGLVIPSGPFQIDQQGTHYELKEMAGHTCSVIWSDPIDPTTGVPTGAEPTGASYQVECRAERDGLTYDLYSSGLTPDEATHYLDLVLEATAD
jgi:hypothetical protein